MLDLGSQLRDYLDATAPTVELQDIATAPSGEAPVRPLRPRTVRRPIQAWATAAATATAFFLLVGGVGWLARSDRPADQAGTPAVVTTRAPAVAEPTTAPPATTSSAAPTTTVAVFGAEDALDVAAAYFDAYNAGDVVAVYALLAADAEFSDNFGAQNRDDWNQLLVWNAAQGTALSSPDCVVLDEEAGVSVKVVCRHENLDALVQAVDSRPVPISLTLLVTPAGILEWKSIFDNPDFNEVGAPFDAWLSVNHPDVFEAGTVGFGNWDSVEEAEANGVLTAQYAAEWAAYLETNGCGYRDGC